MNVVMDDAAEVYVKGTKPRREIGEFPLWTERRILTISPD